MLLESKHNSLMKQTPAPSCKQNFRFSRLSELHFLIQKNSNCFLDPFFGLGEAYSTFSSLYPLLPNRLPQKANYIRRIDLTRLRIICSKYETVDAIVLVCVITFTLAYIYIYIYTSLNWQEINVLLVLWNKSIVFQWPSWSHDFPFSVFFFLQGC